MNLATKNETATSLRTAEQKLEQRRFRIKDKSDYSALEMVLDNKTKHLIAELAASGAISHVVATVSSGKEAVIFSAEMASGQLAALKIFKHGAMDFRRREKYFAGDRRFDNQQLRNNPRKMVKLWAEKEYRNLKLSLAKFI